MRYTQILPLMFIVLCASACQQEQIQQERSKGEPQVAKDHFDQSRSYDSGDVVFCGFLDSRGDLWFGTSREGVFRYDGESFTNYTVKDGLSSNSVNDILEDHEGKIWFGTGNGLSTFDGERFEQLKIPFSDTSGVWLDTVYPIVNPNGVMSLLQDQNGTLWIGTNGAGALAYDGKHFKSYLTEEGHVQKDGLHHNVIMSIVEDHDGNIWFTSFTHGGVSKFDGDDFTHYTIEDGVGDDMIMTSFIDQSGNIWFGTRAGGMSYFDGEKFTLFTEEDGLCANNISSFYQDEEGTFLLGSFSRNAMCRYDGTTFQPFPSDGNPELIDIRFTLEDTEGNLWFGGRHGLLWSYDGTQFSDHTNKKY